MKKGSWEEKDPSGSGRTVPRNIFGWFAFMMFAFLANTMLTRIRGKIQLGEHGAAGEPDEYKDMIGV